MLFLSMAPSPIRYGWLSRKTCPTLEHGTISRDPPHVQIWKKKGERESVSTSYRVWQAVILGDSGADCEPGGKLGREEKRPRRGRGEREGKERAVLAPVSRRRHDLLLSLRTLEPRAAFSPQWRMGEMWSCTSSYSSKLYGYNWSGEW